MNINQLKKQYAQKRPEIKKRMKEFQDFGRNAAEDELFAEVAYCICTPMNHFTTCQQTIIRLQETNILFSGDEDLIAFYLLKNKVRFHNVKAKRICQARAKVYE